MHALPVLIVVWAVFTGLFLALLAYNATLSRYEESQLFLDDANVVEKELQSTVVGKINRILPYLRATGWLAALMTLVVLGVLCWDALQTLQH